MLGQKLRFVLKKAGIKYKEFAESSGKSVVTIQRWISMNEDVGEIYLLPLRKLLGNKIFNKIEQEWEDLQTEKQKRQKEREDFLKARQAEQKLASN